MAVAYVNAGALTSTGLVTTTTPPLPASRTNGNLLLACLGTDSSNVTHTWPAGWTKVDQQNTTATRSCSYAWRLVDGSETAPAITWVGNQYSCSGVFQFSGTSSTPMGASSATTGAGTGTHTSSAIVTTANNSMVVYLDLARNGSATPLTNPAGWTADFASSGSFITSIGDKIIPSSGSSSGAISTAGDSLAWVQWQQELLEAPITGSSDQTLPVITASGTGITDTQGSSSASLPIIAASGSAFTGNSSDAVLPVIVASGTGITDTIGASDVTLPVTTASSTGITDSIGTSAATLPIVTASGTSIRYPLGEAVSSVSAVITTSVGWNPDAVATSTINLPGVPVGVRLTFNSVLSSASLTTSCAAPTIFWEVVTSTAATTAEGIAQRAIEATVIGTAVLNGTVLGSASYQVSAASIAQIISGIQFVQDFWDGWAFNMSTAAASEYEDFKFNSFCRIGANYYGCNDTGIHLLGGGLDGAAQINATITTGTSDLSIPKVFDGSTLKTIPNAYVSARSPTEMTLTCRVEGAEYTYAFRAPKDVVAQSRVDIGKGLRGTFWQFELKNQDGADFEIDSLTVVPEATKRRI